MTTHPSGNRRTTPQKAGTDDELVSYINFKLAVLGQPTHLSAKHLSALEFATPLVRSFYQKDTLLSGRLCPVDNRIQRYLDAILADVCPGGVPRLPWDSLILDVGSDPLRRIPMMEPTRGTKEHVEKLFAECALPADLIARLAS